MSIPLINYTIIVDGDPIPKARHRTQHKDRDGNALDFVRSYSTQGDQVKAYRKSVLAYLTRNYPTKLLRIESGPISMGLTFIMPVRKNWPQYKLTHLKQGMIFYHFKKPDLDNLIKFTKDVLEGLCYKNDSQISVMDPVPMKIYGFEARTIIQIRTLPEFENYM